MNTVGKWPKMNLIPMKINDGSPRNSIGQLISIAVKYGGVGGARIAGGCTQHAYECNCDRRLGPWLNYLRKELGE